MKRKPVIGMPEMGSSLFRRYMKGMYIRCLHKAGGTVHIIPWDTSPSAIQTEILNCDGFLFPGGPDIDPALYGQLRQAACGDLHPQRDNLEFPLMKAALEADCPILAICRGMQVLNVLQGGTLKQDIAPLQKVNHADYKHRRLSSHTITIEAGTVLDELFQNTSIRVNSIHHQAVDQLGEGLTVTAVSEDGFVEGLQFKSAHFCQAVQWHPEHMARRDPMQQRLFDALIGASMVSDQ